MPALELRDVRKLYRSGESEIVAVDHATLTVEDAELLALVGPSGSGKSTLLSIAGGLLTPSEGTVRVAGEDVSTYGPKRLARFRRDHVGFVFQSVNLVPFLTVFENLFVVSELTGRRGRSTRRRAAALLEELGVAEKRNERASDLSGGERQRVAIGRALVNEPRLVLFDEPTSALDTERGVAVMRLIRREVVDRGIAGVVVTHDQRMARFCDRTVEIIDGRLAAT
jgi:putative ABC transport system ATP-binding protein